MAENVEEMLFLMEQVSGTLFSLANKTQVKGDEYIGALTSRQLMAMIAIAHLPENKTSLKNIARKLGTTKQNIKQIITILKKKGYVVTVPGQQDRRAVNVKITKNGKQIAMECGEKGTIFLLDLFHDFTKEELEALWRLLKRMYSFDGEAMDGFEEQATFETGQAQTEMQARVVNEFLKRRKGPQIKRE
jgi:DNA-binding MarR family transcriptional regulator